MKILSISPGPAIRSEFLVPFLLSELFDRLCDWAPDPRRNVGIRTRSFCPSPYLPAIPWKDLLCFDGFSQIKVNRRKHGSVGAVGQKTDTMLDIVFRLLRSHGEVADGDPFLFRPFYDVL